MVASGRRYRLVKHYRPADHGVYLTLFFFPSTAEATELLRDQQRHDRVCMRGRTD